MFGWMHIDEFVNIDKNCSVSAVSLTAVFINYKFLYFVPRYITGLMALALQCSNVKDIMMGRSCRSERKENTDFRR